MKFVIASDSHGRRDLISELSRLHKSREGFLFLGDGVRDLFSEELSEGGKLFASVRGNCDYMGVFGADTPQEELLLNIGGFNILMLHGHTQGVKSGIERAAAYALKRDADVLLFGHTHLPLEKYFPEGTELFDIVSTKPLYVFNPGSLSQHSYGLMQIKNDQILFSHGEI